MKNGIFFLTYDGYYNFTSGIGTQTKTFLKGLEKYYGAYSEVYGEFEINLIVPDFDETVYGYNKKDIDYADKIVSSFGGKIYRCSSSFDKEGSNFWTSDNWEKVSASAASIVLEESRKYKNSIVITVDPPFLHTPKYIASDDRRHSNIQSVILMYTSAYIHDEKLSYERLGWEYSGLSSVREYPNIKVGNVCNYMRDHFVKFYGVGLDSFVPYSSSLFLEDSDFIKLPYGQVLSVVKKYNIPLDRDIIFAFGRTAWVKGFDTLLKGFSFIKDNAYLVLLATQFEDRLDEYKALIQKERIDCTLITEFKRDLPVALCQYERCKIVVCPSRREPFSNIPLEVGLWAKENGPVVLASDLASFREQIQDGENGFIFPVDDPKELAKKAHDILGLSEKQLSSIRLAAYNKVVDERDFFKNFGQLLNSLWW